MLHSSRKAARPVLLCRVLVPWVCRTQNSVVSEMLGKQLVFTVKEFLPHLQSTPPTSQHHLPAARHPQQRASRLRRLWSHSRGNLPLMQTAAAPCCPPMLT
jgi:hypothetical protein